MDKCKETITSSLKEKNIICSSEDEVLNRDDIKQEQEKPDYLKEFIRGFRQSFNIYSVIAAIILGIILAIIKLS